MVMIRDCYCAICASSLLDIQVGSKSEKGQRVRSKVLRNRGRQRLGLEPGEPVSESDDDNVDKYDDEHSDQLRASYDPHILEGHDTCWITEVLLVANDPRKRRAPRPFLCGLAGLDYGGFGLCRGTYDEWKYDTDDYECEKLPLWAFDDVENGESAGLGNFPCHVPCLKMLAKAITGTEDFHQLDIYPLHRAIASLYRVGEVALDVDYGDKAPLDQKWKSYPGEEVRRIRLPALGFPGRI
jgi:hypothetical protein